jgi:hypothetical protein
MLEMIEMNIQEAIQSQYRASLGMLQQAVVQCPDAMWADPACRNEFWQVAYHALFYVHLYLTPPGTEFIAWTHHRPEQNQMEAGGKPYSKAEILAYYELVCQQVAEKVTEADLDGPSGFHWLPFNRLELHFYIIRHLQHHIGELYERLSLTEGVDIHWTIKG